jgi:hypothetical protein
MHSINGLSPSARIGTGHAYVLAGDIIPGMKVQLDDGALVTVLSAYTYWTDAQRVKISTKYGEISICSEAHLACTHPMCELYFGCSEVAYPVKAMVGYDPAFSWQPRTELSECVGLELDQIGWIQINGLSVFIPPFPSRAETASKSLTPSEKNTQWTSSLHDKFILSPEETIVLSTLDCSLVDATPPTHGANGAPSEFQLGHSQ